MYRFFFLLPIFVFFLHTSAIAEDEGVNIKTLFDKVKNGVVSIESRISHGAYTARGVSYGTGFIVDKNRGLIMTNRHVLASASIGQYYVSLYAGRQLEAQKIYEDAYHDFALLKVDPAELPEVAKELTFSQSPLKPGQTIVIVGKNEGQDFSFQSGRISSLYETSGFFPSQSMRLSLNTRGGGSGSPVLNADGEVVAIIYSGNMDSSAFALHTGYLKVALREIQAGISWPERWEIGAKWDYLPVDKLVRHDHFPETLAHKYREMYPEASGKILHLCRIFHGTAAQGRLQVGDVLMKFNGEDVGPNLENIQLKMNQNKDAPITLTVMRHGQMTDITLTPERVSDQQVKQLLAFGGGTFYEIDPLMSNISGANTGRVMVTDVQQGSAFHHVFPAADTGLGLQILIESMDGKPIRSLDDLLTIIPELQKKENFCVTYRNYGVAPGYNQTAITTRGERRAFVSISRYQSPPMLFSLDRKTGQWKAQLITYSDTVEDLKKGKLSNMLEKEAIQAQEPVQPEQAHEEEPTSILPQTLNSQKKEELSQER